MDCWIDSVIGLMRDGFMNGWMEEWVDELADIYVIELMGDWVYR
jgi:hypothetical protein